MRANKRLFLYWAIGSVTLTALAFVWLIAEGVMHRPLPFRWIVQLIIWPEPLLPLNASTEFFLFVLFVNSAFVMIGLILVLKFFQWVRNKKGHLRKQAEGPM